MHLRLGLRAQVVWVPGAHAKRGGGGPVVTCRRKRYDEDAAMAKIDRIVSQDAAVGLTTEGRVEWCAECEAWHVATKAAWRDAS